MHITYKSIINFFEEILNDLECQDDTKNYIINIFAKYKSAEFDLSKDSITILFMQARNNKNYLIYQNLGDFLFFTKSIFPPYYNNFESYYDNIAKISYLNCYKQIPTWKLYEQLADEYVHLTNRCALIMKNITHNTHIK